MTTGSEDDARQAGASDGRPALVVLDAHATPEEVAALVAVLQGITAATAAVEAPARPRSAWADPSRRVRRPLAAGPGGWRASSLPG